MKIKLLIALGAVIISAVAATAVFAAVLVSNDKPVSEPEEVSGIEEEKEFFEEAEGEGLSETTCEPQREYTYLKGTMYKNLYATKYQNLVETMKEKEPVLESGSGSGSGSGGGYTQVGVGSVTDPGYSGSAGKYSMSDKTVAAHLSVQGTSIQDKAIWQCSTSTTYYEPSSVAWAAKTAHLRSGELSQNTVIYGHNWNNCFVPFKKTGSQFESLMAYTYEDFVAENQYIYLTTNGGVHTFKVFAVCFTKDLTFYINCNNIDVASVASKAMGMSLFDFGVSVGDNDKIITLSTCTRYYSGLGANQRFIIMGKLISTD
ncbi:MAG: class B sortase [Oscillospiraceae bacterium]|nr:class B sortase [Oscillospiraceae bacterium]